MLEKVAKEFGPYVRSVREASEWTISDLSVAMGVSTQMVEAIERGESEPSFHTVVSLARAMDTNPMELLAKGWPHLVNLGFFRETDYIPDGLPSITLAEKLRQKLTSRGWTTASIESECKIASFDKFVVGEDPRVTVHAVCLLARRFGLHLWDVVYHYPQRKKTAAVAVNVEKTKTDSLPALVSARSAFNRDVARSVFDAVFKKTTMGLDHRRIGALRAGSVEPSFTDLVGAAALLQVSLNDLASKLYNGVYTFREIGIPTKSGAGFQQTLKHLLDSRNTTLYSMKKRMHLASQTPNWLQGSTPALPLVLRIAQVLEVDIRVFVDTVNLDELTAIPKTPVSGNTHDTEFVKQVTALRATGISQRAIAEKLNVSTSAVSRLAVKLWPNSPRAKPQKRVLTPMSSLPPQAPIAAQEPIVTSTHTLITPPPQVFGPTPTPSPTITLLSPTDIAPEDATIKLIPKSKVGEEILNLSLASPQKSFRPVLIPHLTVGGEPAFVIKSA